jgi:hypothetical protein
VFVDKCPFVRSTRSSDPVLETHAEEQSMLDENLYSTKESSAAAVYSTGQRLDEHVSMFQCQNEVTKIHCTLVCNFHDDCPDGSDESFCYRQACQSDEYLCGHTQCIPMAQKCSCKELHPVDDLEDCGKYLKSVMNGAAFISPRCQRSSSILLTACLLNTLGATPLVHAQTLT